MEWIRQYSLPLLLALALHVLAAMALYANWNPPEPERRVIEPRIVQSQLVVLEQPKPKPKPAPPQPQAKPPAQKPPPPKPQPKPEPKPEPKPAPEEPKPAPDREAERRAAEERARRERLEALAQQAFQQALQQEASTLSQADASEDAAVAQSYRAGIYQAIVANWSRPASARNRMEAELLVELVPTGHLVNVTLTRSSGNAAFDRSAEAAVRKAAPFEVPKDPNVFEEHFRRFALLFRPEDLLR